MIMVLTELANQTELLKHFSGLISIWGQFASFQQHPMFFFISDWSSLL